MLGYIQVRFLKGIKKRPLTEEVVFCLVDILKNLLRIVFANSLGSNNISVSIQHSYHVHSPL